jgi:uncharacterized protein
MGYPVVHFEVVAEDGERAKRFFAELFDWRIDDDNPMNYGTIDREANLNTDGVGIGGGVCGAPEGYGGHVTFYVGVPDVESALARAESLGGTRMMGPDRITPEVEIGLFTDPEGREIGLVKDPA